MKKHLFKIVLFLAGMTFFTSCMKDDPAHNSTVYYAYQQIPNINEYMPLSLLRVMDSLHCLHYGDEPPKIEGCYLADSINRFAVIKVPTSTYIVPPSSRPGAKNYFDFSEQHKGIANMGFSEPHHGNYYENSSTDSTYYYIKRDEQRFLNNPLTPIYFQGDQYSVEDFKHVYIIGTNPYFTAFYYEIRDMNLHFQPLNAVIISGRVDKQISIVTDTVNHTTDTIERPVIKDMVWGCQTLMYYKESHTLDMLIQAGTQRTPGDMTVSKNLRPAPTVEP
jgi:hypothetical protein